MQQTHAVCGELVHRGSEPFIFLFFFNAILMDCLAIHSNNMILFAGQ